MLSVCVVHFVGSILCFLYESVCVCVCVTLACNIMPLNFNTSFIMLVYLLIVNVNGCKYEAYYGACC